LQLERKNDIVRQRDIGRPSIIAGKKSAIEPVEPIVGGDPDISQGILDDTRYGIVRQPIHPRIWCKPVMIGLLGSRPHFAKQYKQY
jgi:hypothetical protein